MTTIEPIESSASMQELKYRLLAKNHGGNDFQHFHASEDRQSTRDAVLDTIRDMEKIYVNWLWAEKSKTHPNYRTRDRFYALLGGSIAKYLLIKSKESRYEKIVIIFDKALTKKEQDAFYSEVKPKLKEIGKPYAIYFHHTVSDFNGQIADYFAWAKYISLERGECRPLETIKKVPNTEFNIFRNGTKDYT